MRIVGIDLGVTGKHKAVIANERGQALGKPISFCTKLSELQALVQTVQTENEDGRMQVVLEPTGMSWFPVAIYLIEQGWTVFLVNSRQVSDLRRYYKKYAKSDRIDANVLVMLPVISEEELVPLSLPTAAMQACQRGCKQMNRLTEWCTAIQNRLTDLDQFAWPGLRAIFADRFGVAARWFRQHYYDPAKVVAEGSTAIRQNWKVSKVNPRDDGQWIDALVELAAEIVQLYGAGSPHLDWTYLQAEVRREQELMAHIEELLSQVQQSQVSPLYHQLHPSRHLESMQGVGPDGAAVYVSFIGDPRRFPDQSHFRGWSGLVPKSSQSADWEASGLSITQAGPTLIKRYAYINADVARQYDPQLAAIYYDQMVHKGKHHTKAVCACATHLLGRIRAVLLEDRPYELRDVDGKPLTKAQARSIVLQKYQVPREVRDRNNKRARRERTEKRKEAKQLKESPAPR
jgi:transposase